MSNAEAVRLIRESLRRRRKPTRVVIDDRREPAKAVVTFDDGTAIAWCPTTAPRWFLQYWKKSAAQIQRLVKPWWFDCVQRWPRSTL
jgi:hypothetical protein